MKAEEIYADAIGRCTAFRTLRASRVIARLYEEALRPAGLTITQFSLLITIGRAKPESISKIGDYLSIERTTLSRNLKPLEQAGYVTRGEEGDRRKRQVRLTPRGLAKLKEAYPLWRKAQEKVEKKLGKSGVKNVADALAALHAIA